jgi:membrane protein required for colicin V production
MQTYDLVMVAVLGGAVLFGLWKGFAWQVASLASIVVSYFVARNFSGPLAARIGGDPSWNRFLAMFILFFGCSLIIWIAFGFVRKTIDQMYLKTFDRQVGAALGAVKGVVLCIVITLFSVSLLVESVCRSVCTSRSGGYVAEALNRLRGVVPPEIMTYIGPYVAHFDNEMNAHQNESSVPDPNSNAVQNPQGSFANPSNGYAWPANYQPNANSPPVQGNASGWTPGGSWRPPDTAWGPREATGRIEPAGTPPLGQQIRDGVLQQIDWGQAAGQVLDGISRGWNPPR